MSPGVTGAGAPSNDQAAAWRLSGGIVADAPRGTRPAAIWRSFRVRAVPHQAVAERPERKTGRGPFFLSEV